MSVDVNDNRDRLDTARGWELLMLAAHAGVPAVVGVLAVYEIGWPGMPWHVYGGLWALTVGIGIARTAHRRWL